MTDFSIYDELMPKIQALIAPPDCKKEKSGPDSHPYFKRRGKRNNHDYCDACGEKGNVLCCDMCPASFHLLCHNPPMDESDLPTGQWFCQSCKFLFSNKNRSIQMEQDLKSIYVENILRYKRRKESKGSITTHTGSEDIDLTVQEENTTVIEIPPDIPIKKESRDEENIVSESESTSGSNSEKVEYDNFAEKIPSIKVESESRDSSEMGGEEETAVMNMEDVWSIIGVNKEAKVTSESEQSSALEVISGKENVDTSDIRCNERVPEVMEVKDVNICLENCDYLLRKNEKGTDSLSDAESVNSVTCRLARRNEDEINIKKAFADMIRSAEKTNPKQFTLPIQFVANVDLNFVGTEKDADNSSNHVDANDVIKLPSKKCYYCKGTCVTGQLISCDFCPAHFHLNCLNPPICAIPDAKWMCPLHPHHIMDRVMTNPSSLTEFLSWWNKLSGPVDDGDVRKKFIDRVSTIKRTNNERSSSVKVPDMVKYHYKYPVGRILSMDELIDTKSECSFTAESSHITTPPSKTTESAEQPFGKDEPTNSESLGDKKETIPNGVATGTDIQPVPKRYNLRVSKKNKASPLIEIVSDDAPSMKVIVNEIRKKKNTRVQKIPSANKTTEFSFTSNGIYTDYKNIGVAEKPERVQKTEYKSTATCWKNIEYLVLRDVNRNFISGGIAETALSEDIRKMLMLQSIKMNIQDLPPSFMPNTNPYPFFHPLVKDDTKDVLPERPRKRVRAVLCPLSHHSPLVYMYDHCLNIGSAFTNDVCLLNYGFCNLISEEHAVIFYDEITNSYELINYSEYYTVVDNIHYTSCISQKSESPPRKKKTTVPPKPRITQPPEDTPTCGRIDTPQSSPAKRKTSVSPTVIDTDEPRTKRTGSTVIAAEARNAYKKLLQDIDKLVCKSQEEMARIAEDDLYEISKAVRVRMPQICNSTLSANANAPSEVPSMKKKRGRKKGTKNAPKTSGEAENQQTINKADKRKLRLTRGRRKSVRSLSDEITSRDEAKGVKKPKIKLVKRQKKRLKEKEAEKNVEYAEENYLARVHPNGAGGGNGSSTTCTVQIVHNASNAEVDEESETECLNEYCSGGDFFAVSARTEKCKCQVNGMKFPNGRDTSWERAAPLYHGSYIRFGCVEFVFSIVNYPPPSESRPYTTLEDTSSAPETNAEAPAEMEMENENEPFSLQRVVKENSKPHKEDDLSLKLISILNLLSSKDSKSSTSKSPSSVSDGIPSSGSSPYSSRSSSPPIVLENANSGTIEITHSDESDSEKVGNNK